MNLHSLCSRSNQRMIKKNFKNLTIVWLKFQESEEDHKYWQVEGNCLRGARKCRTWWTRQCWVKRTPFAMWARRWGCKLQHDSNRRILLEGLIKSIEVAFHLQAEMYNVCLRKWQKRDICLYFRSGFWSSKADNAVSKMKELYKKNHESPVTNRFMHKHKHENLIIPSWRHTDRVRESLNNLYLHPKRHNNKWKQTILQTTKDR